MQRFPASGANIGLFLADMDRPGRSVSSLNSYFYALKWAHRLCAYEDPTNHPFPLLVMEGVRRSKKDAIPKKRTPIDSTLLINICKAIKEDGPNLRDLRFASMATLSYAGLLRISEVLNLKCSDVSLHPTYIQLFIAKSKTDQKAEGTEIYISAGYTEACPLDNLQKYLAESSPQKNWFLFRNITSDGTLTKINKPMTYTRAREELRFFLTRAGVTPNSFGWHSFRRGGTTTAARAGVSDRQLKDHGRWLSDRAKNCYIEPDITDKLSVSKMLNI